jgi:hypothetical protein
MNSRPYTCKDTKIGNYCSNYYNQTKIQDGF